jgi:hypothetical protein
MTILNKINLTLSSISQSISSKYYEETVKFIPIYSAHLHLIIVYKNTTIEEAAGTTLLGLHIDKHMNWEQYTDQILQKPNAACFVIGKLFPALDSATLRSIFFAYFHQIIKYGIIL